MTEKRQVMTARKSREIERTIYTDWANNHLEKTGVKRLIQDLPKDIADGVVLADIVQFVCEQPVDRIHSKPSTTKQKLHNIERCLQVLQSNKVVLNDVSVQGLYRGDLKCVLALFFHLSRYKQKAQDFKMGDSAKSQKRCLRPPTTVSVNRKSKSFNANDKNRINTDLPTNTPTTKTTPSPINGVNVVGAFQSRVSTPTAPSGTTGWRSKSMNAKHTATTRLVAPRTVGSTFQTFKPDSSLSNNTTTSTTSRIADTHLPTNTADRDNRKQSSTVNRLGSPSRLQRSSRKPSPLGAGPEIKGRTAVTGNNQKDLANKSSLQRPAKKTTSVRPESLSPSRIPDKSLVKSTGSVRTTANSSSNNQKKLPQNGVKSTSVMSRLRKLGSPTSASTNTTSVKSRSTSSSKTTTTVTSSNTLKKRAESCPPTSRLSTVRPAQLHKPSQTKSQPQADTNDKSLSEKSTIKSPSGLKSVKSSIGKAFSGTKQNDKKKSPSLPSSRSVSLSKTNKKLTGITKSEIRPIIPMVTNANQPVQPVSSHTNGTYEVSDKLSNVVFTDLPSVADDVTKTQPLAPIHPAGESVNSCSKASKPVSISIGSHREVNKAQKTATVAPFMRHTPIPTSDSLPVSKSSIAPNSLPLDRESPDLKSDDSSSLSAKTPAEAREKAVKGIADLRHNLEETMCSLRNTQLRHHKGDAFQRRISAQLDGEIEELNPALADIPPFSSSTAVYRSHHNLLSCRTGAHSPHLQGSASPKLHAGETLVHHSQYKFGPGQFSSLQRTRSARYPRTAWREITTGYVSEGDSLATLDNVHKGYTCNDRVAKSDLDSSPATDWEAKDDSDNASTVSSCDLSDYIGDVSTDEHSSINNSPYRQMKTTHVDGNQESSCTKLEGRLSKSTVSIEHSSKSLKQQKKKGPGKPPSGIRAPGSNIVGSRLACNANTPSPTGSPLHPSIGAQRGTFTYRSLPRPSKSKLQVDTKSSGESPLTSFPQKSSSTFKRSPSLQKLLGIGKSKQNSKESSSPSSVVLSNPHISSPSTKSTTVASNQNRKSLGSDFSVPPSSGAPMQNRRDLGHYSSLGRPSKSSMPMSTSPLSYLSLPRRTKTHTLTTAVSSISTCPATTMMTWSSPKRSNANSAHSISPATSNPFMSLDLLTPSLYLNEKDADAETLLKQTASSNFERGVSDWPLPTLHSASNLAGSTPNMAGMGNTAKSNPINDSYQNTYSATTNANDASSVRSHSVVSAAPSLYSLAEDETSSVKLNLQTINGDLNSKAKAVSEFEENLSSMNNRLRQLSVSAEEKDYELQELRSTIESLKRNNSPDAWSSGSSGLKKKASCGSLSSISSKASVSSIGSTEDGFKKKKKHWLRESLKTAFGKRKSRPNLTSDIDETESTSNKSSSNDKEEESDVVAQLREELLKKERKLTDIRLEALTSQHQLHQMQDAMHRMRNEMETLRLENERLNRLGLSTLSLDMLPDCNENGSSSSQYLMSEPWNLEDSRMTVMVEYPHHVIHDDTDERSQEHTSILGVCHVPRSCGWQQLDRKVQHVFQDYCKKVDPVSGLGLSADAVVSYTVGEARRFVDGDAPDLLPCGYIIGNVETITLQLKDGSEKSVDSLALELLLDRKIVDKYTRLILEHGRVMLCGPTGTGKSTLANRLAEHVTRMIPKRPGRGSIVRLDLKQRNENEIADYLHKLSEDCSKPESSEREIPAVLVLDDLHRSSRLKEAFTPLLNTAANSQLPYLIGVAEKDCGSGLELHHEFKWILCSNHAPPVRDFLGRALRRKLCTWESTHKSTDNSLHIITEWLPNFWHYINKCIETHNSADVTLGPRMFTSCPMDTSASSVWFKDLWNFSIVPYVISAVKQGRKRSHNTNKWNDPLEWIKQSWPWPMTCDLLPIRAEDVTSEEFSADKAILPPASPQSTDPLLNMLLKLQEAAATNYESDTSHDDTFERSLDRALGDLS